MYLFWGHCDLDLILRILVAEALILYYLGKESRIWCMDTSLDGDMLLTVMGSL